MHASIISALAFVPLPDVVQVFEELQESSPQNFEPVIYYFEHNYIDQSRRQNRGRPPYSHDLWNMHGRAEKEWSKTNNLVERWHRRMDSSVIASYPSFWCFLEVLKCKQTL